MACISRAGGDQETKTMLNSAGYCFSDASSGGNQSIQPQVVSQFQSYEPNQEIYCLTSGMELIGFPPKNLHQASERNSVMWKEFFGKSGGGGDASASKGITGHQEFYNQQDFIKPDFSTGISDAASDTLMAATNTDSAAWNHHYHHDNRADHVLLDDPSLGSCVLRPNQGLSLSLGCSNPVRIGLQSVELRQTDDTSFGNHPSSSRDGGFFGKSVTMQPQQQQQLMQDQFLGKAESFHFQNQFQMRSSKYLGPAQELLNEFCNLGSKQLDGTPRLKIHKSNQWEDQEDANSSAKMQFLYSLDHLELQKRKAKLLQMLEEVDRRYEHYRNQMRAVVSSFEAVAGNGAATVYSTLASKAMSRHFRCLRDGIVGQLKATKKALGEKDTAAPGATRGETPRLRIVDQALRQQRAFQQMSMMESHPWRPQRGLPERAVSVLRAWLFEHFLHPYPSDVDKHILARQTGLSRSQVSNWFINARVRLWKPMVEEMYVEEAKEQENMGSSSDNVDKAADENINIIGLQNQNTPDQDQKPTHEQLVRTDSECLSSIINKPDKNDANKSLHDDHLEAQELEQHQQNTFGRVSDPFGSAEFDFSTYNPNGNNVVGNGGGVSLTLGLQQHGGGGMSLAFSPAGPNSLFYSREHIEDCPSVQYSILDSETQNLPYRNLMGAQLLHDLAG